MPGECGAGHRVEEENGAREDADGGQVGGAGGEGFATTTSRLHLQGGDNNEHARHENDEQCDHLIKSGENKKQQLVEISIRAREGKQVRELPEEVIDCVETSK